MTDPLPSATPSPAVAAPAVTNIGFLSVVQDAGGVLGGYLVTNTWGRPLEFRLSTAVQPNRVQQILYGPTLAEYLHGEVIGKTLVEKTGVPAGLVVTDTLAALALRTKIDVPVVTIASPANDTDWLTLPHPRSSAPLAWLVAYSGDRALIEVLLEKVDPAVDLAEPFARIREAVAEARKMGGASRAA